MDQVTDIMVWFQEVCFQLDILPPTNLKVTAETQLSEGKEKTSWISRPVSVSSLFPEIYFVMFC